ncbi:MAG: nuclear transport factor 2 family protein [Acidimicrobiales bacterium]
MEAWELTAREAIRETVADYAHAADQGRSTALTALFTADGVLKIDGREPLVGRGAIEAMLDDVGKELASSAGPGTPAFIRHHVSSLAIELDSSTRARCWSYFLALSHRGPDHWGRYRDHLVLDGATWRFAERRVSVDGRAPTSAL